MGGKCFQSSVCDLTRGCTHKALLRHNHTERQEERQAEHQASAVEAAAASQMQVYGDASLDAPNGSQIHCINLTLHLPLTLGVFTPLALLQGSQPCPGKFSELFKLVHYEAQTVGEREIDDI